MRNGIWGAGYLRCDECGVDKGHQCRDDNDNRMSVPCPGRKTLVETASQIEKLQRDLRRVGDDLGKSAIECKKLRDENFALKRENKELQRQIDRLKAGES